MAIDQNFIPKDLRPLNLARSTAEEPRPIAAGATGRNIEGFVSNPARDVNSPRSRLVFYPATVSDVGFGGGLGFGNPTMGYCPRPTMVSSSGIVASGFSEVSNSVNQVGGNAGDQAIDAGVEDSSLMKKVKFLCSFGGKILPRPSDGMLRYVGGHTRIISVRRDISFQELVQKMIDTSGQPVVIKYQLPDEDLDALVSVSCSEDLDNMMEEYGKLVESSSDGSAKLRIFLFSASELDTSSLMQYGDLLDRGQRYLDAVNGILGGVTSGITRKGSVASLASTQNSDSFIGGGEAIDKSGPDQGDGGGPLSPEVPAMPWGLQTVLTGPPTAISTSRPEIELDRPLPAILQQQNPLGFNLQQPSGMDFLQPMSYVQTYVDPHQEALNHVDYPRISSQIGCTNPQLLGVSGSIHGHGDRPQQLHDNAVGVPPQQVIPAVHMTMASSAPHVGIKANGFLQFMQPHQTLADPYPEENKMGSRLVRLPVDQSYKAYQAHSPIPLQAGTHGWHQVLPTEHVVFSNGWLPHQQGICPEQIPISEDCFMCQKSLPHVHSDTLVQGNRDSITSSVSDSSPTFHSLHLEDNLVGQSPNRGVVSGASGEGMVELQGAGTRPGIVGHVDHDVTASHIGTFAFSQDSEMQHNNGRILQKPDNPDNPRMVFPQGMVVFPGDVKSQHGVFLHNIPQSCQEDAVQQASVPFLYQVNEEGMMSQPVGADITPARITHLQTSESLVQESSTGYSGKDPDLALKEYISDPCLLSDQPRSVDGKIKGDHGSPSEISGSNEQCRLPVDKLKKEEVPVDRPQISGKEMLMGNASTKPRALPHGNHISPIETLPSSSSEVSYFHYFQPVGSGQVTQPAMLGISGPNPHLNIGIQNPVYAEMSRGELTFSDVDSSYAADMTLPISEWKDEASHFQSKTVFNDAASGPSSGASANLFDGVVGDNRAPDSTNSLFSNQDPWTLQHETHFPPPRPNKVPVSKEAFSMMEEGIFHKPSVNVNKDSNLEHLHCNKEEHIKQELKAVAEGVAAVVLQSSTSVDSSAHDFNKNIPEANQNGEVLDNDVQARIASKVEDVKTKLPDKTNPGLLISGLQIIKNVDLEELQELGSGTFGTVYYGKWRGSEVAIKRINDRCFAGKPSEEARMREDFWNEAIKLADLHHPNVVAFYGVVLDGPGGSVATVTEYMVNGSLRQALQRNDRAFDKRKRLLIAMDVAFGMEYLHGKNIVHFDLKSDNLLVNLRDPHRPICKVGDLGLSKVKCQTLISGGVRGTLPWMAPELLNGSSSLVSEKVDVFSFGIVMWELLTGEEPYANLHYGAIIGGIVSNTLRPPVPESCDPEWRSLMERCWSSEPLERPSFTEIANQLRSMAASLPAKGQTQQQPLAQK